MCALTQTGLNITSEMIPKVLVIVLVGIAAVAARPPRHPKLPFDSRCQYERYPQTYKRCGVVPDKVKDAVVECTAKLDMKLPCDWQVALLQVGPETCHGHGGFRHFFDRIMEKRWNTCVAKTVDMVDKDDMPDVDKITEYMEKELPVLKNEDGAAWDLDFFKLCMETAQKNYTSFTWFADSDEVDEIPVSEFANAAAITCAMRTNTWKAEQCLQRECRKIVIENNDEKFPPEEGFHF